MPIYAYKCESCGHTKDVLQKVSDEPLSTCPACGSDAETPGHFLMECPYYTQHRQHLFSELTRIAPQQQMLLAQAPVDEAAWKLVSEHFWNAGRVGGRTRPILGGEDDDRPRWVEAFSHIAEFVANAWYARCALMSNNQPLAAPSASPAPAGGGGAVGAEAHGRDASCGV